MKFGPVPLNDAAGAVLAHSVKTSAGRLRKGLVLGPEDVSALRADGIKTVTVAQLDSGDLDENAAAAHLAAALVPDPAAARLRVTEPFTGRVNLIADGPGVVELNVAALEAACPHRDCRHNQTHTTTFLHNVFAKRVRLFPKHPVCGQNPPPPRP